MSYERKIKTMRIPDAGIRESVPAAAFQIAYDDGKLAAAEIANDADREIADKDQRIKELEQALQDLLSVAPAEPPAKGLLKGIEEQHKNAIETAKKLLVGRG
jgi:hypothetical protein